MNKWGKFTLDELIEIEFGMTGLQLYSRYTTETYEKILKEIRDELDKFMNHACTGE